MRRPVALGARLPLAAELLHYTREVAHGLVEVVVDDDTGSILVSLPYAADALR